MRLPDDSQRQNIYGQTGSGKTVVGVWSLEKRSWLRRPWTIFDFKGDTLIARIPRLEEIDIRKSPPKHPGLYVVRPLPDWDNEAVETYLWKVWDRGKHGLYIDEAYMMGRFNKAYDAVLTQGRSKRVPVIACSQRPSWLSRFQMSEADFHQVMHVQNPADVKRLQEWVPGMRPTQRNYHSQYYDVAKGSLEYLKPVPDEDEILNRYDMKMPGRTSRRLFTGLLGEKRARRMGA